jgi:hypothetical protein
VEQIIASVLLIGVIVFGALYVSRENERTVFKTLRAIAALEVGDDYDLYEKAMRS